MSSQLLMETAAAALAYKQMLRRPKDRSDIEALLHRLGRPDPTGGLTTSHAAP